MSKKNILESRIQLFTPMDTRDPCIAIIAGFPAFFKGKTPMQAHRKADDFRKREVEKLTPKSQRPKEVV